MVPHVRRGSGNLPVGGVDDHVIHRRGEQVRQVGPEDRVLGQLIDDVGRDCQVGGKHPGPVGEAAAVVEEKWLLAWSTANWCWQDLMAVLETSRPM